MSAANALIFLFCTLLLTVATTATRASSASATAAATTPRRRTIHNNNNNKNGLRRMEEFIADPYALALDPPTPSDVALHDHTHVYCRPPYEHDDNYHRDSDANAGADDDDWHDIYFDDEESTAEHQQQQQHERLAAAAARNKNKNTNKRKGDSSGKKREGAKTHDYDDNDPRAQHGRTLRDEELSVHQHRHYNVPRIRSEEAERVAQRQAMHARHIRDARLRHQNIVRKAANDDDASSSRLGSLPAVLLFLSTAIAVSIPTYVLLSNFAQRRRRRA